MRPALDSLIPTTLAIVERLQRVDPEGLPFSVSLMTFNRTEADKGLMRPGRVLSF